MYNRYIPQPDGSYHRKRVPDASRQPQRRPPVLPKQEHIPPPPPDTQECRPGQQDTPQVSKQERHTHDRQVKTPAAGSVGSFLRQLLPKDFDTSDLLIVLLLLLMAGDCEEDQNNALLTLALYLFM